MRTSQNCKEVERFEKKQERERGISNDGVQRDNFVGILFSFPRKLLPRPSQRGDISQWHQTPKLLWLQLRPVQVQLLLKNQIPGGGDWDEPASRHLGPPGFGREAVPWSHLSPGDAHAHDELHDDYQHDGKKRMVMFRTMVMTMRRRTAVPQPQLSVGNQIF